MHERLRSQRLVALFAAGWLLLNFPLLTLWDRDVEIAGWPLLPTVLFLGWALLIGLAAWVVEAGGDDNSDDDGDDA
ncbi:hypothetical protein [Rivibacter subsaxonicus]|uniref:DUF3311 domain-containing protein n=1 Tax=Rivibacter subsaxonicus TaxID=457575 RepID=A0A4Q7VZD5_9BURK|nr:hypothetical protein [Rivibacter subsaxonicus]RZU02120.1 hypothetical protein EV670_0139 [Rivibacter subsaxonicus]